MAVRTKALAIGVQPTSGAAASLDVYTAPAGETVIVKQVFLTAVDSSLTVGLSVRRPAGETVPIQKVAATGGTPIQFGLWLVLQPGDVLIVDRYAGGSRVRYHVSGTELEGVAD